MTLFARYVVREVLLYTAMVMSVLLLLVCMYQLVDLSSELGVGRFGIVQALVVMLCRIPGQAFMLLPVGALMAAMLALGNLARGSELLAMRAAGVSPLRLAGWVSLAGILLAGFTWLLGDYLAPPAEQFAAQYKRMAKTNQFAATGSENTWAKDGNTFVFIQKHNVNGALAGVYVLQFDDQRRLQKIGKAESARIGQDQRWHLSNYVESRFHAAGVSTERQAQRILDTSLSGDFLGAASADPDSLTGRALLSYIAYLEKNHLLATEYRKAFWTRVARTAALVVIVMLAVPFSFGPMRSTGTGARMVIGILVGAIFFLIAKVFSNGGVVYGLDPLVVAWGPTVLLAATTFVALLRVR